MTDVKEEVETALLVIDARDLRVGDTIMYGSDKRLLVKAVERGSCGKGMHVNVVRRDTRVIKDKQGNAVGLNAERGSLLYSDGCWNVSTRIMIRRPLAADGA